MNSYETFRSLDYIVIEREARRLRAQAVAEMIAALRARISARRAARRKAAGVAAHAPVAGKPRAA